MLKDVAKEMGSGSLKPFETIFEKHLKHEPNGKLLGLKPGRFLFHGRPVAAKTQGKKIGFHPENIPR